MEIPEDIWLKVKLAVKPEMDNEKLEAITKGYIGDLWRNTESPLWKLAAYAISRKVWIGCFDRVGGDEGEEFLNARDELAAKGINAVMQEGRVKNVILYGALHFEDTRPGRKGKTDANWVPACARDRPEHYRTAVSNALSEFASANAIAL
jgi:hypothetical protein